jgi:hypothetical protein
MRVLGNYKTFQKFMGETELKPEMSRAIKIYLNTGGVLKVEKKKPLKIIYPNKNRLKNLLIKTEKKESYLESQISFCRNEVNKMTADSVITQVTKVVNPTYWQHLIQLGIDGKYRKDFEVVNLPMEMMHVPRYKKIIEMFITNPEYRERLIEARTSSLGKLRQSIKESAHKAEDFKKDTVNFRAKKLEREKKKITLKKKAIKTLISASNRFF